jgi:hypothetical protein
LATESSGPRVGAGQSSPTANSESAPAIAQPNNRSGSEDIGADSVAGKTKASRSAVPAPASTELTTPAKSTTKPTTAIVVAASQALWETNVPSEINTQHATTSVAWFRRRLSIGPRKSVIINIANDPKAAISTDVVSPITWSQNAKTAGITMAARPARRSPARS